MTSDEQYADTYEETYYPEDEETAITGFEEEPVVEVERGLGFTDGFQFGCGFWAAALVTAIVAGLLFLIATFLLSFVGVNLLG